MPHGPQRRARAEGQRRRTIELLEQLAIAAGADVDEKEQCLTCGDYFKNVAAHERHCKGPE
jgi:hypothetical protein